jgi:hypothetical protein
MYTQYFMPALSQDHVRALANVLVHFFPQLLAQSGQQRIERGCQIAQLSVSPGHSANVYEVKSQSMSNAYYEVDIKAKTCTCPDSAKGNVCKHRIAVAIRTVAGELLHKLQMENLQTPHVWNEIVQGRLFD